MRLKELRVTAKLTQEAVADVLGISRTTIAMWESGASSPRSDKLPILAKLYNCTIDELFGEDKPDEQEAV